MESMDNGRERLEALAQQMRVLGAHTRTVERRLRWWRGLVGGVLLMNLVSLVPLSQAADFTCAAGDVGCLITAITTANANGEANTITLEAGTYTLTAVDNTTEGANGLPSVTSTLTMQGAGAATTTIEGGGVFRLLHVATTGRLILKQLTLLGGESFNGLTGPPGRGGVSPTGEA